jgi:predicted GNAT family acetyltransferase
MATEFTHEPDAHRYTMHVDGDLVSVAEYLDHGAGMVFHHTVTIPRFRGKGYADQLVTYAMNDVEARGAGPVSPTCWYVAEWFDRHPERASLLAPR